ISGHDTGDCPLGRCRGSGTRSRPPGCPSAAVRSSCAMTRPTPARRPPGRSAQAVLLVVLGSAVVAVAASDPGGWSVPGLSPGGESTPVRLAGAAAVLLGLTL